MEPVASIRVPLGECDGPRGRRTLYAVLDELTLTYTVVDGDGRALREHLPSRSAARAWARAYGLPRAA